MGRKREPYLSSISQCVLLMLLLLLLLLLFLIIDRLNSTINKPSEVLFVAVWKVTSCLVLIHTVTTRRYMYQILYSYEYTIFGSDKSSGPSPVTERAPEGRMNQASSEEKNVLRM